MNTNKDWLDIASAPKDGTEFLARWGRQGGVIQIAKWDRLHGYFVSKGEALIGFTTNVTEWAPLPPFDMPAAAPGSPASTVATEGEKDERVHKNGFGSVSFKLSDGFTVSCEWSPSEWSVNVPAKRLDRDVAFKELLQEIGRLRAVASAPAAGDALDAKRYRALHWMAADADRLQAVMQACSSQDMAKYTPENLNALADAALAAIAQQSQRKEA
nr:hypothetical protein [uncultured Achromobacter sp.]